MDLIFFIGYVFVVSVFNLVDILSLVVTSGRPRISKSLKRIELAIFLLGR
tara:strand:- start:185352 stop:185501 length:150 start_codon:yes stop_codon:yes gene_type:complete